MTTDLPHMRELEPVSHEAAWGVPRRFDHASKKDMLRRHRSGRDKKTPAFNAVYDTEELFLGTCDRRGVCGAGILVNTSSSINTDSLEKLTTESDVYD
ncbi:unnamed protein product [Angiostrongylus costaricensis]|uniref:Uncharacterized protein n=1 Tax=Angiostrongylus costaricensis TaxID=334426 RepID=A0A0R3PM04_ANGCS|nr:unnamed protein product [Angiostrongylus costaricensis]